ncbi:hypothetical protein MASR1M74_21800 [Lentimicrobium sp.]
MLKKDVTEEVKSKVSGLQISLVNAIYRYRHSTLNLLKWTEVNPLDTTLPSLQAKANDN